MPVARDIAEAYIRPRQVMARKLSAGHREDRALAYLMGACALIFIAQWPLASRLAHLDPSVSLEQRIGGALQAWLIIMPLVMYGVAAFLHVLTRVFRGAGTWFTSRLVLFWTLLALSPMMLLQGLTAGMIGPSVQLQIVQGVVMLSFFWIWTQSLRAAESPSGS